MWQNHYGTAAGEVFSESRQYSVEIHSPAPCLSQATDDSLQAPELLVFQHRGDAKELLWRKALPLPPPEDDQIPFHGFRSRTHLTNDGRTVVLSIEISRESPILSIISKTTEVSLDTSDLLAILPIINHEVQYNFNWLLSHESLDFVGEFNSHDFYVMWLRPLKQWVVTQLDQPAFKIPSPVLMEAVHQEMLRRCRETVQMYEVRKASREKPRDVIDFSDIANAYRFIAINGDPVDKPAAERLLATPFKGGLRSCPPFGLPGIEPTLGFDSSDRALGAELLTHWGKADTSEAPNSQRSPQTFFGGLAGIVRFPFALPNPPGTLVLTITPVTEAHEASESSPINIEFALPDDHPTPMQDRKSPRPAQLRFSVHTLDPGRYRIKAVWERRPRMQLPPWVEREATPDSKGGAYESAETESIAVQRGEVIEGIRLDCIHKMSADPELYRNDKPAGESAPLGKHEIVRSSSPKRTASQNQVKTVFSGPAQTALIRQQQSEARIMLRELRLEQFPGPGANGTRQLKVTFIHLGLKNRRLRFDAELRDDGGKSYQGSVFGFGAVQEIWFSTVPLKSKLFTITVFTFDERLATYDPNDKSKAYQDTFELRNLLPCSENTLTAESLPIIKVLDVLAVELREVRPSEWAEPGSRIVEPVFRFFDEDGREAPPWTVCSVWFQDSLGNTASLPDQLPGNESVVKMHARFLRDVHTGRFDSHEHLQFQLPRVPLAREFLDLRRLWEFPDGSIELFGVGGPGAFTYEHGKVLSATDLSPEETGPLRIDEVRSEEGTHFHVSGSSGFRVSILNYASDSVRVLSRWPHVVFRKTLQSSGIEVRVKEEVPIRNLVEFRRPPRRSEMVFVPLVYEPGDVDKRVTIIAQRPREAEFIIRLPV